MKSASRNKEIEKGLRKYSFVYFCSPFWVGGKTVLLIKPYNRAMLVEPFHILKTNEYCTPFSGNFRKCIL